MRTVLNGEGLYSFTSKAERRAVEAALRDTYDTAWKTIVVLTGDGGRNCSNHRMIRIWEVRPSATTPRSRCSNA
ncbi:hypothetical protein GCM10023195_70220 [Actinoallomurus liliacearum]|uniref:Uncharacterized protein n=1 Tax=Actinoallomurus liliacearum TaxID=1080073 RepID=A0ABP8TWB5_9ACTN